MGHRATLQQGSIGFSQLLGNSYMTGGSGMDFTKTGIDRRYTAIQDIREPAFQRDLTKNEGNIAPDFGSSIKIHPKKQSQVEPNPFEKQISARMGPIHEEATNNFPKVTFAAKQVFSEVCSLSEKVPSWDTPAQNPINTFVPEAE